VQPLIGGHQLVKKFILSTDESNELNLSETITIQALSIETEKSMANL
jgi:hypothetical protein